MNPQYSAHVYKIAIQHNIELILYYVVTVIKVLFGWLVYGV
jgi:hypothetical protein